MDSIYRIPNPSFLIVSDDGNDHALTSSVNGEACFLLYTTRELAELYIEQVGGGYRALEVSHDDLGLLVTAVPSVPNFAVDNTVRAGTFKLVPCSEFRPGNAN